MSQEDLVIANSIEVNIKSLNEVVIKNAKFS